MLTAKCDDSRDTNERWGLRYCTKNRIATPVSPLGACLSAHLVDGGAEADTSGALASVLHLLALVHALGDLLLLKADAT